MQILLDYYFPKMGKIAVEIVVSCKVYDRHAKKHDMCVTPIPSGVGELIHIDIFSTARKLQEKVFTS